MSSRLNVSTGGRSKITAEDLRLLRIWLAAIILAGALPNLVQAVPDYRMGDWLLLILAGGAAGQLSRFYFQRRRRKGVAALLYLADTTGGASPVDDPVRDYLAERHEGWFRVGPEPPGMPLDPTQRAQWALSVLAFRLADSAPSLSHRSLHLFVYSRRPEAFSLGRAYREREVELAASARSPLALTVGQISSFTDKVRIYSVVPSRFISARVGAPISPARVEVEKLAPTQRAHELALVMSISGDGDAHFDAEVDQFFAQAVAGLRGDRGSGYNADPSVYHSALLLAYSWQKVEEALVQNNTEAVVNDALERLRGYARPIFGEVLPVVHLILKGPPIIAFSLGYLLPEGSQVLRWGGRGSSSLANRSASRYIAIIDGDQVGDKIEQMLWENQIENIVEKSSSLTLEYKRIGNVLQEIVGVELLIAGGDSLFFSLEDVSLDQFLSEVDRQRQESKRLVGLGFSCGVGRSPSSAFSALRRAKASGRGSTFLQDA